jgi:bacteriocin-like protein
MRHHTGFHLEADMDSKKQDSGNPRPDSKPQPEKTDIKSEELTDQELRAISGGYVVHGQKPPPPTRGWNPQ